MGGVCGIHPKCVPKGMQSASPDSLPPIPSRESLPIRMDGVGCRGGSAQEVPRAFQLPFCTFADFPVCRSPRGFAIEGRFCSANVDFRVADLRHPFSLMAMISRHIIFGNPHRALGTPDPGTFTIIRSLCNTPQARVPTDLICFHISSLFFTQYILATRELTSTTVVINRLSSGHLLVEVLACNGRYPVSSRHP